MEWFIQLHRKMLDWEWYDDINTKVLFIHLLLKANWKDKEWRWTLINRWSLITSYSNLSNETWLSVKQVRTCISKLIKTNEVAYKGQANYSIIKLINYDLYQSEGKPEDKQMGKQRATTNKDNNIYIELDKNFLLEYKNNKLMNKLIDILENCNIQQHIDTKKAKWIYDYFIEKSKEYKLIKYEWDKWDTTSMQLMLDKFRIHYEDKPIKNIKTTYLTWITKQKLWKQ